MNNAQIMLPIRSNHASAAAEDSSSIPLIARIAGLPISALEPLSSRTLRDIISQTRELYTDLELIKQHLLAVLHTAIPHQSPPMRRRLLHVRREYFNGRSLRNLVHDEDTWRVVSELSGSLADNAIRLENRAHLLEEELQASIDNEHERNLKHLFSLLDTRGLHHGISLSSPSLARGLQKLRESLSVLPIRRRRKATQGLARYATRAAYKLSPFSTLTRTGLAVIVEQADGPSVSLLGGGSSWQEQAIVSFKRSLIEQCTDLLVEHYTALRERIPIRTNTSTHLQEDGKVIFVQPGRWTYNESGELYQRPPNLVKMKPKGILAEWLLRNPNEQILLEAELLTQASHGIAGDCNLNTLNEELSSLLKIGLLVRVLPWPTDQINTEQLLCRYLEEIHIDGAHGLTAILRAISTIEHNITSDPSPAYLLESLHALARKLWEEIKRLCNLENLQLPANLGYLLHEDVFVTTSQAAPELNPLLLVSRQPLLTAFNSLRPLARLSQLFNRRHDFLHTIAAFAAQQWPDKATVPFMEFLALAQPIFREFYRFEYNIRNRDVGQTFNPFTLSSLSRLYSERKRVLGELGPLCANRHHIDPWEIHDLLATAPDIESRERDFCVFLQPADSDGRLWVLNDTFEGRGRNTSRYLWAMDSANRSAVIRCYRQLAEKSNLDGVENEMIDVLCPGSSNINVHPLMTSRVLVLPGEQSSAPPEAQICLSSVSVDFRDPGVYPRLIDNAGIRLAPINLSPALIFFMPSLLKFLLLFGPGCMRQMVLPPSIEHVDEFNDSERFTIGNVVLRRRRWEVNIKILRRLMAGRSRAAAFLHFNLWREEMGIPDRVFLLEWVESSSLHPPRLKPQYIDFSSPILFDLLTELHQRDIEMVTFEELLPRPNAMPKDVHDEAWAVEFQVDSALLERLL